MKSKILFLLMTLALFSMFVSCKNGAEASGNYEDPDSLLIPKLISLEVFDNEWSIEKIYEAQNSYPQNSPNSPVEFATRTIWASSNLLKDNVLIEHHLYRYEFPLKDIEDFVYTVNGKYSYIETDINGIELY